MFIQCSKKILSKLIVFLYSFMRTFSFREPSSGSSSELDDESKKKREEEERKEIEVVSFTSLV